MSKKIATIAYLKELYGKLEIGSLDTSYSDTYCPTYSEITGSKYYVNGTNKKGLLIGTQYSVNENVDGHYEDNQCVCEIDITAIKADFNLSIIQSGTTNYGSTGTVDCMVDYNELISGTTPYNDLPYLKTEFKSIKYQKNDDGQEITSSSTSTDLSNTDSVTYTGNATLLTSNGSTKENSYTLSAKYKEFTDSITINQLGETYGYYADSEQKNWVTAIDYKGSSYSKDASNRITTGWLDDYGDNTGTTGGRDTYNTDSTDYRRGIEVKTNIDTNQAYVAQSMSGTSSNFKDPLPTVSNETTYHMAFADDANTSTNTDDSFHWIFKDETTDIVTEFSCYGGGSHSQASISGSTYNKSNYYDFVSFRTYFKPQHCYGRTSIDRIYKKDANGNFRRNENGDLIIDKGFSQNPIDKLQGQYPQHWRRQIATYKQYQSWSALTADAESMAKVTIYERKEGTTDFSPSHRTDDGNKVSSAVISSAYSYPYKENVGRINIYFPDNRGGSSKYEAYPVFHYLSPEKCEFEDDTKTNYYRSTASTLTNYEEGDSGKAYAYNMSIGASKSTITQDNDYNYLAYNNALTYDKRFCDTYQITGNITYIVEYSPTIINNIVFKNEVEEYINGTTTTEPTLRNGVFDSSSPSFENNYTIVKPYSTELATNGKSYSGINYTNQYYTIITNENKPVTKEDWEELYNNGAWTSTNGNGYLYTSTRDDGKFLKSVTSAATVPYQTIIYGIRYNTDNTVTARIDGDLSSVATVRFNPPTQNVAVSINYGTDFNGSAYIGNLVVSDDSNHTIIYPINNAEKITMATARSLAANGYEAINKPDNYWCTTETGKGDKNQQYMQTTIN